VYNDFMPKDVELFTGEMPLAPDLESLAEEKYWEWKLRESETRTL
jgi:hypothetical protein